MNTEKYKKSFTSTSASFSTLMDSCEEYNFHNSSSIMFPTCGKSEENETQNVIEFTNEEDFNIPDSEFCNINYTDCFGEFITDIDEIYKFISPSIDNYMDTQKYDINGNNSERSKVEELDVFNLQEIESEYTNFGKLQNDSNLYSTVSDKFEELISCSHDCTDKYWKDVFNNTSDEDCDQYWKNVHTENIKLSDNYCAEGNFKDVEIGTDTMTEIVKRTLTIKKNLETGNLENEYKIHPVSEVTDIYNGHSFPFNNTIHSSYPTLASVNSKVDETSVPIGGTKGGTDLEEQMVDDLFEYIEEQSNDKIVSDRHKTGNKCHLTNIEGLQCLVCPLKFPHPRTLALHKAEAHKGTYTLLCDRCGRLFNDKARLNRHIIECASKELSFKCHICIKEYRNKSTLSQHLKTVHKIQNANTYVCEICTKKYRRFGPFERHMQSHD